MELGLSLGGSSKPLKFLEKRCENQMQGRPGINGGPDFAMALGLKASSGENETTQKKSQESEDEEDEEPNTSEEERTDVVGPVQLNLLPGAPVPHRKTLPWCSDNGSSENGSSGNMGVAAARGPAEEASSANSMFRLEFAGRRDLDGGGQSDAMGSSRASDDDDSGPSCRKKLRLSKQQSAFLEETFKDHNTLNPKQKQALAKQLNLRPRQVEVWFQNRRARTKLKQTEVDCEYLKRCCETLTDENRRLQRELHELRALKISAPFYMHSPATTLTMCPSCERVASAAPPPSAAAAGGGKIPKVQDVPASSPFALDRPKFFPFSQSSFGHPQNRPAAS